MVRRRPCSGRPRSLMPTYARHIYPFTLSGHRDGYHPPMGMPPYQSFAVYTGLFRGQKGN
ncbi:Uncharacterised protein [Mycobacteroides abscessus subsp. abscessus]|nr:Uncharacterised protein [Mycobacteroides abscessus subsp. abscessus]